MKKKTSNEADEEEFLLEENNMGASPPSDPFGNHNILSRILFFWVVPLIRVK